MVVTDAESRVFVSHLLQPLLDSPLKTRVKLLTCSRTNKRAQLCLGFSACKSQIILIADDDTIWSPNSLPALTRPLQASTSLGGVFPEVQIRPQTGSKGLTFWETLASIRLFGDAIDGRASVLLDGSVFCASGSTAAYRASILQDEAFQKSFQAEEWRGQLLNAGDDQSLTRWLDRHGWDVMVMPDDGAGWLGYGDNSQGQGSRIETHGRFLNRLSHLTSFPWGVAQSIELVCSRPKWWIQPTVRGGLADKGFHHSAPGLEASRSTAEVVEKRLAG